MTRPAAKGSSSMGARSEPVFVFGSNLAGRHGKGAALYAARTCGAERGVGEGHTGNAYALPTKDAQLRVRPAKDVEASIVRFCDYARANPHLRFRVTPVGTGLAGFPKREIWSMFKRARMPENCDLTSSWLD